MGQFYYIINKTTFIFSLVFFQRLVVSKWWAMYFLWTIIITTLKYARLTELPGCLKLWEHYWFISPSANNDKVFHLLWAALLQFSSEEHPSWFQDTKRIYF